jgi:methylmalonyl-CoA mutase N-terminal domain/subunit
MSDTLKNVAHPNTLPAEPETSSHIPVRQLYTPADLKKWDQEREAGYPGEYPFTRGVQATMYRGRLWTMRQYAGMGDAEESNKRYKYLLANGTTGLSVAFDLPTQIGLDSDNPLAVGEVGKVGVAIDSVEDMERLFSGIDLTKISTSMTINATASILLLYVAVARRQGANVRKLGTVQNDVLKEYIARGNISIRRIRPCNITDMFAWPTPMPDGTRFRFRLSHARGGSTVQEAAFSTGDGMAYAGGDRCGPDVDCRAPLSSSTRTAIFWRKWRNSGRRAGCGRASCVNTSLRRIPSRGCCASTRRRPGRP